MKSLLCLFLLAIFPLTHAEAKGGAFSGGGGGITTKVGENRILADFLWIDPGFTDSKEYYPFIAWIYHSASDKNDFDSKDPFRAVSQLIEAWQRKVYSPGGILFADFGLLNPAMWHWRSEPFTDKEIPSFAANIAPFIQEPKLAAYYSVDYNSTSNRYRVDIYQPEFSSLGMWSQVGLLLHESLRHAQWKHSGEKYFNEESLQKAVAIMTLCTPRPILSTYVSMLLTGSSFLPTGNFTDFSKVISLYCNRTDVGYADE